MADKESVPGAGEAELRHQRLQVGNGVWNVAVKALPGLCQAGQTTPEHHTPNNSVKETFKCNYSCLCPLSWTYWRNTDKRSSRSQNNKTAFTSKFRKSEKLSEGLIQHSNNQKPLLKSFTWPIQLHKLFACSILSYSYLARQGN